MNLNGDSAVDTGLRSMLMKRMDGALSRLAKPARAGVVARLDRWKNTYTGWNTSRDKVFSTTFNRTGGMDPETLRTLYNESDIMHRVCTLPAQEMTREWIEIETADPAHGQAVLDLFEELNVQQEVTLGLAIARWVGGAVTALGADDRTGFEMQMPPLEEPLMEDDLRSLLWMQTYVGRSEVEVCGVEQGMHRKGFGDPTHYRMRSFSSGLYDATIPYNTMIHASKAIRFNGLLTDRYARRERLGWDYSVAELVYDTVLDFDSGFAGASRSIVDLVQSVFKIDGLKRMLLGGEANNVLTRLQYLDMYRSSMRAIVLDTNEEYQRDVATLTSVGEVLDRLILRLSAATGIPVTVLMGRSPAGLNATGESDIRTWYDLIRSEQKLRLRPVLERLIQLAFLSKHGPTKGFEPPKWRMHFKPLWANSEAEQAAIDSQKTNTIIAQIDRRLITAAEGREMLYPDKDPIEEEEGDAGLSFLDLRLSLQGLVQAGDLEMVNKVREAMAKLMNVTVTPLTELAGAPDAEVDPLKGLPAFGGAPPGADGDVVDEDVRVDASIEEIAAEAVSTIRNSGMADRIVSAVGQVIPREGSAAMGALGSTRTFDVNTAQVDAFIASVRERADAFDQTTIDTVERAAQAAIDLDDANQLVIAVQNRMDAAQRLARDEAHKAINFTRTEAARQVGNKQKAWNAVLDGRTRPAHRRLHGQRVAAEEPFRMDGFEALEPGGFGDPSMDANCRCYVTYSDRTDDLTAMRDEATGLEREMERVAGDLEGDIVDQMKRQLEAVLRNA